MRRNDRAPRASYGPPAAHGPPVPTATTGGFTLVELLIVLAIIGTLSAMLLAALRGAMGTAETVQCANNLRQIGLAVRAYGVAWDFQLPPSSCPYTRAAREQWWLNALQPYAGHKLLYRCPSDVTEEVRFIDWQNPPDAAATWNQYRWSSYATNGRMDTACTRLDAVRRPSSTIYVCESPLSALGSDHVHPERWVTTLDLRNSVAHDRHGGRANYLFIDGHVDALTVEETWQKDVINLWNPKRAPQWSDIRQY